LRRDGYPARPGHSRVGNKCRRCHSGIVHPGDRGSHDDAGQELLPGQDGRDRRPQGGDGRPDRDENGQGDQDAVVADVGWHAHGRHAGVVHRDNADAHENTAKDALGRGHFAGADHEKAESGDPDGDAERKKRQTQIITDRHRHDEGEHADEVHRPNPASHGNGSRRKPHQLCPPSRVLDAATEVECGVGRETRNRYRERDEVWIVGADDGHWLKLCVSRSTLRLEL
jgi:hypothetical protein